MWILVINCFKYIFNSCWPTRGQGCPLPGHWRQAQCRAGRYWWHYVRHLATWASVALSTSSWAGTYIGQATHASSGHAERSWPCTATIIQALRQRVLSACNSSNNTTQHGTAQAAVTRSSRARHSRHVGSDQDHQAPSKPDQVLGTVLLPPTSSVHSHPLLISPMPPAHSGTKVVPAELLLHGSYRSTWPVACWHLLAVWHYSDRFTACVHPCPNATSPVHQPPQPVHAQL